MDISKSKSSNYITTDKYRENYQRIYGKKKEEKKENNQEETPQDKRKEGGE